MKNPNGPADPATLADLAARTAAAESDLNRVAGELRQVREDLDEIAVELAQINARLDALETLLHEVRGLAVRQAAVQDQTLSVLGQIARKLGLRS